ncbi:hypothetical protein Pcinc_028174 [Petrolisthes cinctipes]|uniref:Uncharacterized protein n=1 Tax=Petrolisthes cinctipes TaxID=88211 RepID=A0AAE1F2V9_PETCI|nr:hypothetical protein Pcinc_028174 [Petrolisthes cinctipes]
MCGCGGRVSGGGGGGRGSVAPVPVWGEVRRSWRRAGPFQAKLGGRSALRRQSPPGPLQGSPPSERSQFFG